MKRLMILVLAVSLLLTACGKREETVDPPVGETALDPVPTQTISETGDYAIVCEWEEYDPSVERLTFWVENRSAEALETGVDFQLERLEENGDWSRVPTVENAGWVALGLYIPAGGRTALTCHFSFYDYDFSGGGTYRIVKELNGQSVAGTFKLVEDAAVSAERPYGFASLETLPESFGAANAMGGEVVFTGEPVKNIGAVKVFLDKSGAGVACQLRTVQDYGEGAPMVIDVIYENDHFLWRMWSDGSVTERRFSYIVTDGTGIYLSNGVDWEQTLGFHSDTAFLIPEGVTGEMLTTVERQAADRLDGNVTRYRVWSEDGVYNAALTVEPTEFAVNWQKQGEGSRGELFDLQSRDGLETAITGLEWQEDGSLLLICDTVEEGMSRLTFDTDSWSLKDKPN